MLVHYEFVRFMIVGVISNLCLYLLYLLLTGMGVGYKLAMTLLFCAGVSQTFLFNKNWSFGYSMSTRSALVRYWTAYGAAYILNFFVLLIFVDWIHFPHELVQGIMIVILAILLFFLQKLWVFRSR